jgi:hypothetical protein
MPAGPEYRKPGPQLVVLVNASDYTKVTTCSFFPTISGYKNPYIAFLWTHTVFGNFCPFLVIGRLTCIDRDCIHYPGHLASRDIRHEDKKIAVVI